MHCVISCGMNTIELSFYTNQEEKRDVFINKLKSPKKEKNGSKFPTPIYVYQPFFCLFVENL